MRRTKPPHVLYENFLNLKVLFVFWGFFEYDFFVNNRNAEDAEKS